MPLLVETNVAVQRMSSRYTRILLSLAFAFMPAVAAFLLVLVAFGKSLLSFTPVWTDEVDYWREINTFSHVGFAGGYYTINEHPAPATFTHFGSHGLEWPVLLGSLSRVTGWASFAGPLFNLACLAAAMLVYFYLVRPSLWHQALATLSLLVFWPVLLYIPSSMEETFHQSLGVVLAGIFYVVITKRDQAPRRLFVAGIVILAAGSLLRLTWGFLFIPLFLFQAKTISWRWALRAILLGIPLVLAAFAAYNWLTAPYPNFSSDLRLAAGQSLGAGIHLFFSHLKGNLILLLLQGAPLERSMRYQVLIVLALALGLLAYGVYRRRHDGSKPGKLDVLSLFHVLNLAPVLLFILTLYDVFDWRDFRMFAPHLLLSILLTIPFIPRHLTRPWAGQHLFVYVPLALNLLLTISFLLTFQSFHAAHFASDARPRTHLASLVTYQPGAQAWHNTVLVDGANYTAQLMDLPPGIGVSTILAPGELKQPIKSRYLLVSDATMKQLGNPPGWELLGTTPTGNLYVYIGDQAPSP